MHQKVSIIVPCYNQEAYLNEALQSVMEQTYETWECIIVNDGSTDGSEKVAKAWCEKDSRFRYFTISNSGVSHARNFGISQSTGDYILPLDGDDKISPNFVAETVNALQHEEVTLAYGSMETFGASKEKWADQPYNYRVLLHENMICCTALYRKKDFDKTIGYNENMKKGLEDWDFWLTLLNKKSNVVKLKQIKFFYRRKELSRSAEISPEQNIKLRRQIINNHKELYDEYLPDVITLYNEKYNFDRAPFKYLLKYFVKKILGRS
ncbi:MAG: glycosyltransferase family 2 protein [Sphingobacteriales bacterium]|nr:MAG: glycosyltransferase family 2 protein [Sphingobacteriales bacterium]